jgi:hypothetical protein
MSSSVAARTETGVMGWSYVAKNNMAMRQALYQGPVVVGITVRNDFRVSLRGWLQGVCRPHAEHGHQQSDGR